MSRDRERARRAGYRQGWFDAMAAMGVKASMPIEIPPSPYGDSQHAVDRQAADTSPSH